MHKDISSIVESVMQFFLFKNTSEMSLYIRHILAIKWMSYIQNIWSTIQKQTRSHLIALWVCYQHKGIQSPVFWQVYLESGYSIIWLAWSEFHIERHLFWLGIHFLSIHYAQNIWSLIFEESKGKKANVKWMVNQRYILLTI